MTHIDKGLENSSLKTNIQNTKTRLRRMNGKRPRIAVIGSTNVDFCSYVSRLPQAGETIGNGVFMQANGGKGANQAVAAARLGGEVSFVTAIGTDGIGDALLSHFKSEGLD